MAPKKKSKSYRRMGRLTREGRVFVLVTVGVGIAAVNTGNNLLYLMLGLLLSLLLISMVMSEVVLFRLTVTRSVPKTATAGRPFPLTIRVRNRKQRVPSYALEVLEAPGNPSAAPALRFLKVRPNGEETQQEMMSLRTRGRHVLSPLFVRTRYPFGLVEKTHVHRVPGEILVYPQLEATGYEATPQGGVGTQAPGKQSGHGPEVAGIRDYAPGDAVRDIHALRSAALQHWVVRSRLRDSDRKLSVHLDTRKDTAEDEVFLPRFERMIRRAAYVVHDALTKGMSVRVVVSDGKSPRVASGTPADPVLAFLAELQPAQAEASFRGDPEAGEQVAMQP